jgi:hypothetical protein
MGANNPTPEKCTITKQKRRPRPMQGCGTSKEEMFCYHIKMQVTFWSFTVAELAQVPVWV